MSINNALEYQIKEQKEIKEKKSDGDDNDARLGIEIKKVGWGE